MTALLHISPLVLESNPSSISLVEPYLAEIARGCRMEEEKYGSMLVVLTEAVTNAIVHGNKACGTKKVTVKAKYSCNTLTFCIQDQGNGFDPSQVPDPTKGEQLCMCGGRGVYIIKQLADYVRFGKSGREVKITFNL